MRCIARKQHATDTPPVCNCRMELIHRCPSNGIGVTRRPGIQECLNFFRTLHFLPGFTLVEFKLPASIRVLRADIGCEAFWVTYLNGRVCQCMTRLHLYVDHQPVMVVAQIIPANAHRLANKTIGTITTKEIGRGDF